MLIAHLPVGYVVARLSKVPRAVFWGLLIGSVLPDFDMLWFLFVDHGSVHHHSYLTHRPLVWIVLTIVGVLASSRLIMGIGAGALLHMLLDSIAGQIAWGWPFSHDTVTLVVVPATHSHWILSFMAHWTFAVELVLCVVALWIWMRKRAE
jgi:inner membrane protein